MSLRDIKEIFKSLQNGPFKGVVAVVATINQILRYRSFIRIYIDQEGDWYNCRNDVTFVSPELNVTNLEQAKAAVKNLWCYDYDLKAGDTVIDIGAGIGDEAVCFSRLVGETGSVVAIEAHPDTFRCLEKTVAANNINNITCLNMAISNKDSEIEISSEKNFLSNSIMIENNTNVVKVPARVLDHVLAEVNISRVDLIKMNIEGAETVALKGMSKILANTPNVVISCHDFKADRGDDPVLRTFDDVCKILSESSYRLRSGNTACLPESSYYVYGKK